MATPRTVNTWPLNGVVREFDITFDYLSRNFIQVMLIGGDFKKLVLGTDYTFVTNTRIRTTLAYQTPYTAIEIRRVTSTTERLVEFQDASILHAQDLNIDALQVMHVAEEAREAATETIGVNGDGNLDARGRRIVNVADAVNPQDALTLGQYQADRGGVAESARQAAQSATNAATSAGQASSSAIGAGISATNANQSAIKATQGADRATTQANSAKDQADRATLRANDAQGSAGAAAGSAGQAAGSATAAAQSASGASGSASAAASSLSIFQGQYWGTYAADPTSGPGGRPRAVGVFYFNTATKTHRVWDGAAWQNAPQGPKGNDGAPGQNGKDGSIPRRGWRFSYVSPTKVRFAPYHTEFVKTGRPGEGNAWGIPSIYQDESPSTTEYTLGQGAWGGLLNEVPYVVVDYGVNSEDEISVAPMRMSDAQPIWDQEYGWIQGGTAAPFKQPIYGAFMLINGRFYDDDEARCVMSTANQPPRHMTARLARGIIVPEGQRQVLIPLNFVALSTRVTGYGNIAVTVPQNGGGYYTTFAISKPGEADVQIDGCHVAFPIGPVHGGGVGIHHPMAPGGYTAKFLLTNAGMGGITAMGAAPLGLNTSFNLTLFDLQ